MNPKAACLKRREEEKLCSPPDSKSALLTAGIGVPSYAAAASSLMHSSSVALSTSQHMVDPLRFMPTVCNLIFANVQLQKGINFLLQLCLNAFFCSKAHPKRFILILIETHGTESFFKTNKFVGQLLTVDRD